MNFKIFLFYLISVGFTNTVFARQCETCGTQPIAEVLKNINNLNTKLIDKFLCNYDSSCKNNVEFVEIYNEAFYKIINKSPKEVITLINQKYNQKLFLEELENPMNDLINLQQTYDRIKTSELPSKSKQPYLNSILIAAGKSNTVIKK